MLVKHSPSHYRQSVGLGKEGVSITSAILNHTEVMLPWLLGATCVGSGFLESRAVFCFGSLDWIFCSHSSASAKTSSPDRLIRQSLLFCECNLAAKRNPRYAFRIILESPITVM